MGVIMKRQIFIILFFLSIIYCYAESGVITLSNKENYWFYFCIDPEGVNEPPTESIEFYSKVLGFYNEKIIPFLSIPPSTTKNIKGLYEGSHLLLGFWGIPNAEAYPVWNTSFVLKTGESRAFNLYQQSHQQMVKSNKTIIPENTTEQEEQRIGADFIAIDNVYDDWKMLPRLASFSKSFNPITFSRQTKNGIQVLPIEQSSFWGRGGTQIIEVKALLTDEHIYLYFSSHTRFTGGLSVFLYVFEERKKNRNNYYRIELLVDDTSPNGKAVLWQQGKQGFDTIGVLKNSSFYIETRINLKNLPKILLSNLKKSYSFDLVTSFFDNVQGAYEDFFFSTIYFKDIITGQDLNE